MTYESVTYTNENGKSITFGNDAPYLFINLDGTSLGKTQEAYNSIGQDGQTTGEATFNARTILCNLMYTFRGNAGDYRRKWTELCSILSPKLKGTLTYSSYGDTYKIECSPFELPVLAQQSFSIQFIADYPYWQASEEISFRLGSIVGGFSFPFSFNPTVSFGEWVKTCTIENDTGIDTPFQIEMTTVSDYCKITNEKGEFIKVDRAVETGQRLVIDTFNLDVKLYNADGTYEDANNKVTLDSTYFVLHQGTNTLILDNGQTTPAVATISYNKLYLGV